VFAPVPQLSKGLPLSLSLSLREQVSMCIKNRLTNDVLSRIGFLREKSLNAQLFFLLFVFFLLEVYNNNIVVPRAAMLNCIFTAPAGARRDGTAIISVMSGRLETKGKRKKIIIMIAKNSVLNDFLKTNARLLGV